MIFCPPEESEENGANIPDKSLSYPIIDNCPGAVSIIALYRTIFARSVTPSSYVLLIQIFPFPIKSAITVGGFPIYNFSHISNKFSTVSPFQKKPTSKLLSALQIIFFSFFQQYWLPQQSQSGTQYYI